MFYLERKLKKRNLLFVFRVGDRFQFSHDYESTLVEWSGRLGSNCCNITIEVCFNTQSCDSCQKIFVLHKVA